MEFIKAFGGMRVGERNKLKSMIERKRESLKFSSSFGVSKEEIVKCWRHEVATSFHTVVEMNGETFQGH